MAREIPLTRGLVALVDDEDFDWLNQWKWVAHVGSKTHYAARRAYGCGGGVYILMHRLVLGAERGDVVDHRDRDGLNNRRGNLRFATTAQNNRNSTHKPPLSGYRGVHRQAGGSWRAEVSVNNKKVSRSGFADPVSAAVARDQLALDLHGEFAVLNFPQQAEAD